MKTGRTHSRTGERGQTLVFFAILLPLLLAIGVIAVDVGYWYVNQKHAQTTADAAALSGAREIPSVDQVTAQAGEYVVRNMSAATYQVEYPYVPDSGSDAGVPRPSEVEVTVSHPAPAFFGRVFGIFAVDSTRRAVAEQWKVPGNMAIYVNNDDCDGGESLEFNGADMEIIGWTHTEGGFLISVGGNPGEGFFATTGTMQQENCKSSINPSNHAAQFGPDPTNHLPDEVPSIDWPVWYTPTQFGWYLPAVPGIASPNRCRFKGNKIEILDSTIKVDGSVAASHSGTIPTGIYCASETFNMNAVSITGTITALAEEITVNPGILNLTAYAGSPDPVLFFALPNRTGVASDDGPPSTSFLDCQNTKEMHLDGGTYNWEGLIFHPCARVLINGDENDVFKGSIVTHSLKVNGDGFTFQGESDFSAIIELALVE